jgi:hypothetical protein
MQRGGLPLAPPGGQAGPAPQGGSPRPGPSPLAGLDLSQHGPEEFPFLQGADQTGPTPSPDAPNSVTSAMAGSAQSEFGQAVLRLLSNRVS